MKIRTNFTDRFGLSCPVIQAPLAGGGDTAELVSAVSNAGALGFIGAAYLTPEQIIERGRAVRQQTSRPFGINLFAPMPAPAADPASISKAIAKIAPYFKELGLPEPSPPKLPASTFDDQLAAALEIGAAIFSFAFGLLSPSAVQQIKQRGMFVMGTATTVKEAQALGEIGVEAVIAQGSEAGGHRGTFATKFESSMIGVMALVPQIIDAVSLPVIASGGIMDGRGIAAALTLGASAAQMGTAFLTTKEAGTPMAYKQAILFATEEQTQVTRAFSGRPARGIVNRMLRDYESLDDSILPFPLHNALTRPLRTEATKQNKAEYLSLWAGQGIRMARQGSAAELVARLQTELTNAVDIMASRRSE
ncbi:MAG TPA: nitronate monooxygenase [Candidatus Angelobacter sp.]|nr:nitronate monooxygenase [Candidatus Angelobacter sp.]